MSSGVSSSMSAWHPVPDRGVRCRHRQGPRHHWRQPHRGGLRDVPGRLVRHRRVSGDVARDVRQPQHASFRRRGPPGGAAMRHHRRSGREGQVRHSRLHGDAGGLPARCQPPHHLPLHAEACLMDQSDRDLVLYPGAQAAPPWQLHVQGASQARPVTTLLVDGRLEKRQSAMRPAEECRVFIRDHHAGYIDWATYEENRRMVQRNSLNREGDESMAAIRAGQGLLGGLLRCGHCGRKLHVRYWGGRGTNARYLCKGDYDDGGQYCIGFGGGSVDRRVGQELLQVIAPLGLEASLRALEELSANGAAQRAALSRKLEQLVYEAKKAFEQYDAVDARNRLAAGELERRWNAKLEEIEAAKQRLCGLDAQRHSLSIEEEIRIRSMGDRFAEVWQSDHCPPTLKKMIFRTAIEEIIVRTAQDNDQDNKSLELVIHWKGRVHTQVTMERPRSATETATPMEALDIIRCMAARYGDDQIASVLNRRGYSTGKGKRWNQTRVATARRNHSIAGQKRALPDPERVSLSQAARICGVSHRTIERLVEAGLLEREQVTPRAPWEIRRSDLDAAPILRIIDRLHCTGKLILQGDCT